MNLLFHPTELIEWGGVLIIAVLVFAETGLLLGLVTPGGETLIFTAGILASSNSIHTPVGMLLLILILAGVAGDVAGFLIGKKFGRKLYRKKDTWYFKKKYMMIAERYFTKHSIQALIFGKFIPLIRPFCPVISGTTRVKFPHFLSLSTLACMLHISTFILAGYFLGSRFPFVQENLHYILPVLLALLIIPVVLQIRKMKQSLPEEENASIPEARYRA